MSTATDVPIERVDATDEEIAAEEETGKHWLHVVK